MRTTALFLAGIALACFAMTGCDTAGGTGTASGTKTASEDGHDHGENGHEHEEGGHAHGPNGGHPFKFAEGGYQGEWKHYNDNHIIRVYVLDADGKKNAPVKADSVTITRSAGEDAATFTLDAEEPTDSGEAAVYSLDDQDLAIAMNLGVKVEMKIGDKTYTSEIAAHAPHDH